MSLLLGWTLVAGIQGEGGWTRWHIGPEDDLPRFRDGAPIGVGGERVDAGRGEDAPQVEAAARVLWAFAWGGVGAGEDDDRVVSGTSLELGEDLGLGHGSPFFQFDLSAYLSPSARIAIHGLYGSLKSRVTLDRDFRFDDEFFSSGQSARAELNVRMTQGSYDWRWGSLGDFALWGGPGLGFSYFSSGLSAPTPKGGDREDTQALVPFLRLEARGSLSEAWAAVIDVRAGFFGLPWGPRTPAPGHARFAGEEWAGGRFLQLSGRLRWQPAPWVGAEIGLDFLWSAQRYAGQENDGDFGDNRVYLRLLAPSLGVTITF